MQHTVNTTKGYGQVGEDYINTETEKRNIAITVDVKDDYPLLREKLYSFFQPGSAGTLYYSEDGTEKKIKYYSEGVANQIFGRLRTTVISLSCPDPLFYAVNDTYTLMASWEGGFRFPLRINDTFTMEKKVKNLIASIPNPQNTPQGLTVRFTASASVVNPSLLDVKCVPV